MFTLFEIYRFRKTYQSIIFVERRPITLHTIKKLFFGTNEIKDILMLIKKTYLRDKSYAV